jgi:hypothetical protein
MFRRTKHWLWLILCWFMLAGHVWAMPCDVDDDGDIDRDDLTLIQKAILARAPVSGPNDPRDPDSNSRIDSIDGRLCALRCTRARCSTTNQPPFANAGPDQSVRVGDLVALSGAASSDPDGDPLRYLWTFSNRPLGSLASLIDAATVAPHFIADKPGQYLIQLIVSDGKADSAPDTVTVSTENSRPIANAGPDQSVRVGTLVSLNGGGSTDVDGDPLRYTWQLGSVPPGSSATLGNPDSVNPTLLIDRPRQLPDRPHRQRRDTLQSARHGLRQHRELATRRQRRQQPGHPPRRKHHPRRQPFLRRRRRPAELPLVAARPPGRQSGRAQRRHCRQPPIPRRLPRHLRRPVDRQRRQRGQRPGQCFPEHRQRRTGGQRRSRPDRPARQPGQPRRQRLARPRRRPRQLQLVADRQTRRQQRRAQRQQPCQSRLQCRPARRLHRPADRQRRHPGQRTRHGHHFHRQLAPRCRRRPAAERRRRHQLCASTAAPRTTPMATS